MPLKTRSQVREDFASHGLSYAGWAKQRGYSATLVCYIVNDDDRSPKRKCLRGESHNIAVDLGIKEGKVSRAPANAPAYRSQQLAAA